MLDKLQNIYKTNGWKYTFIEIKNAWFEMMST